MIRFCCSLLLSLTAALALDNGVRLTSNQNVNLDDWVFVVHRVFAKGEIPGYPAPYLDGQVALAWQADVHSRWKDGSVKSAHISFAANVPAEGDVYVDFRTTVNMCHLGDKASCQAAGLTKQQMLDFDTGGGTGSWGASIRTVTGADSQTTSGRGMLAACPVLTGETDSLDCRYYLRGPLVTQVVVEDSTTRTYDYGYLCTANCTAPYDSSTWVKHTTAGNSYRHLHPGFVLTFVPSMSSVKTEYWMETAWAGSYLIAGSQALGTQKYSLTLYDGAAEANQVFYDTDVVHYYASTWRKTYWQGQDLDVWNDAGTRRLRILTDYNFEYLIHTGAVPQFDLSLQIERADEASIWDKWRDTYENGDHGALMGTGGFMTTEANESPATSFISQLENAHLWWDAVLFLYSMDSIDRDVYESSFRVLWDYRHSGWGGNAATLQYFPTHLREQDSNRTFCGYMCTGDNATVNAYGRPITRDSRTKIYTTDLGDSNNGSDAVRRQTAVLTAGAVAVDTAHWLENHYISWLIHGDWWWRRELHYFASFVVGSTNPGVVASAPYHCRSDVSNVGAATACGLGRFGYIGQQVRSSAWGMLATARAAFASPTSDEPVPIPSPEAEYFEGALDNNIAVREGYFNIRNGNFYVKNGSGSDSDPCPEATFNPSTTSAWCMGRVYLGYEHYNPKPSNPLYFLDIANNATTSTIFTTTQWYHGTDLDTTKVHKTNGEYMTNYNWIAWGVIEDMGFSQIGPMRRTTMRRLLHLLHAGQELPGKPCSLFAFIDSYHTPTHGITTPRFTVTNISNGNPAVVTTSEPHGYSSGDIVRICCGTGGWAGVNSPNNASPAITVTGPTTFTIPVNTTGFGSSQGQKFSVAKAGNPSASPFQSYGELLGAFADYVTNPSEPERCTWAKGTTGAYIRIWNAESYAHQARAASTWLMDVSDGDLTGTRAYEILNGALVYRNTYTNMPRYALRPRDRITNVRIVGSKVYATAPAADLCTYKASQSEISDSQDEGDAPVTHRGRHIEIDTSGWSSGTWNVRITCGSARESLEVIR